MDDDPLVNAVGAFLIAYEMAEPDMLEAFDRLVDAGTPYTGADYADELAELRDAYRERRAQQ